MSYFPNFLQQLGAPIAYIGLLTTACTTVSAVLSQRFGALSDRIALGALPSRIASLALPFAPNLLAAAGITVSRSFGHNIARPASRALNADLVPEPIRGKLFGRMGAFFSLGAIVGPVLSTWLYAAYREQIFVIPWLGRLTLRGAGLPFIISSGIGLASLLLLVFVEEPRCR